MITQYFSKHPDGMELVVATAAPPVPPSLDSTRTPSADAVVQQVVTSVMAHMSNKRRKVHLQEQAVRQFVEDIVSERTPVHIAHTTSPAQASTMTQLLHRSFGGQVSTWQHFWNTTRTLFAPALAYVTSQRGQQEVNTFFQTGESGSESGSKRRKVESVPAATLCVTDGVRAQPVDLWDKAHVLMRDRVLEVQQRTHSPPPSPRARPAVVKLTETEQFQVRVRQCSLVPKGRTCMDELTRLFDVLNTDTTLTPLHYDPAFDRNDLFLTNVCEARRLIALGQQYTQACLHTKQTGGCLADVPCPAVYVVAIHFQGLVDGTPLACRYITWCLRTELRDDDGLLAWALAGKVVINLRFTELLDKVARGTCQDVARWKQQFKVEVIDDSGGAVSAGNLSTLVALVDMYAEQCGGVGKTAQVVGLNFVQHHHGRHRLIYEAGSVAMYRVLWQCNRARAAYEAAHDRALKAATLCMDSGATFWQRLTTLLRDQRVKSRAAAAELSALARYFMDCVHSCETGASEAEKLLRVYERCAGEKREHVEQAFAAAQVKAFQEQVDVDAQIFRLYECVQANYLGDIVSLDQVRVRVARVQLVHESVVQTWYCPCTPVPGATQLKMVVENLDGKRARQTVKLLRALMLLHMWQPRPWGSSPEHLTSSDLPAPPPTHVDATEVAQGFRRHIRLVHSDKHSRGIGEGKVSAQKMDELTCKVLKARTTIQAHLSTVAVSESVSAATS
jgi:hypothetical protein